MFLSIVYLADSPSFILSDVLSENVSRVFERLLFHVKLAVPNNGVSLRLKDYHIADPIVGKQKRFQGQYGPSHPLEDSPAICVLGLSLVHRRTDKTPVAGCPFVSTQALASST